MDKRDIAALIRLEAEQLAQDPPLPLGALQAASKRLNHLAKELEHVPNQPVHAAGAGAHSAGGSLHHPFQAWLYDWQRVQGPHSLAEVAAELNSAGIQISQELVRAWMRRKDARKIDHIVAKRIAEMWDYDNTEDNWPNGIRY